MAEKENIKNIKENIITKETLLKVAGIARLKLTDDEIDEFLPQLNDVIDAFSRLAEADDEQKEAVQKVKRDINQKVKQEVSIHPVDVVPKFRDDMVKPCFSQEEALSLTKHKKDGYFKGPRVV